MESISVEKIKYPAMTPVEELKKEIMQGVEQVKSRQVISHDD
jgi:hypothetical protein